MNHTSRAGSRFGRQPVNVKSSNRIPLKKKKNEGQKVNDLPELKQIQSTYVMFSFYSCYSWASNIYGM